MSQSELWASVSEESGSARERTEVTCYLDIPREEISMSGGKSIKHDKLNWQEILISYTSYKRSNYSQQHEKYMMND